MTEDEIHLVIRQFIDAAVRAKKAGFDGVQIHGAHVNEGCFVPAAAAVAEAVSCPVMVVGGFRGRDKA
jgi:2,4-dienoyl-CoA reductase-like NADH-dependent reductase (Old Yellow Enzyme family)